MKKITTMLALTLLLVAAYVSAEVVAPVTLTDGTPETRDLSSLPAQQVDAQGGNITQVDIDVLTITKSWQGFFGNITGEITLDNGNNDTFYNWSVATVQGEVYATRVSNPTWSGTACTTSGERATEETALGQSTSDGDSVTNTFNTTDHPAFNVSTDVIALDSCYSTNAYVNSAQDTSRFHQVLLNDGAANIVYATIIDSEQAGFDGATYDFELLVGEDEHAGAEGATTYYFWVELD